MEVDLNCDLGEGSGSDAAIVPLVTSANISCGLHAGSPLEARQTLALARQHQISVGAHPGHLDREHFGRRGLVIGVDQIFAECVYQVGALMALAQIESWPVKYLKPHGGLYHQANQDDAIAEAVVATCCHFQLMVMGLPGSRLEQRARGRCPFVAEGFADRRYRSDGALVPRTEANAFITDPAEAAAQVQELLKRRGIRSICIHGDNPEAAAMIHALRTALLDAGFLIKAFA